MSYDESDVPDDARDFFLDERKLCALSVIDAAGDAHWLTDEEAATALENSELRGDVALSISVRLQQYGEQRNGGTWGALVARLDRAYSAYVAMNQEQEVHERRKMQRKPHAFWAPIGMQRCAWCLEKSDAPVHALKAERRAS